MYKPTYCTFLRVGLKSYATRRQAEISRSLQVRAAALGIAPAVLTEVTASAGKWGYCTELAEPADGLKFTTRLNWRENLDNPEFAELHRKMETLLPGYEDLHSANCGRVEGRLVCIDFFDGTQG